MMRPSIHSEHMPVKKATFKIRRKIILAFLFCLLGVLFFAVLSFQVHREIGRRLKLVEVADDLLNNILEVRRFEKNFFLYGQQGSLDDALSYADRVERLYLRHQEDVQALARGGAGKETFLQTLARYKTLLSTLKTQTGAAEPAAAAPIHSVEDELRTIGQNLLDRTAAWAKEERVQIEKLFKRAMYLFTLSIFFFLGLGVFVAFYLSRMFTTPLIQMQQAMEKIAQEDFTPISEADCRSEEFIPLFRAFNTMIQELERRQEQLAQAWKISAIGTLTSGIAHELNNPVNNIVLTAEALQEDFDSLDKEEALGMINDIMVQSQRASDIIKNLLDFSRSERPEMAPVDIDLIVRDTLKLVRNQLLLSGVEAQVDIPEDAPKILGEYKSLQQVFLNLCVNAIQAMPKGGGLYVRAHIDADGQQLVVEVQDEGIGIDPKNLPQIFDPFFTTKEVGRGTGLGLSVAYGIIKKHGGSIQVQSEKGVGTTFSIRFPILRT